MKTLLGGIYGRSHVTEEKKKPDKYGDIETFSKIDTFR